jgi:hypothetical protein
MKMKSFRQIITEASSKSEVLLFGRMNPPTSGHEENILAAHALAQKHNAHLNVVASHSHDPKKNPLSPAQKTKHLQRAFGHLKNTSLGTSSAEKPNILNQAVAAHDRGVKHLILVGGEDRSAGYAKLLKQYNGVRGKAHGYYNFDHITVKNTGARREGISGTALRNHATSGNYEAFKQHLPSRIASNEKHSRELFNNVRAGLSRKESFNREAFLNNEILQLGETVTDSYTGFAGRIVYRGPTYVTIQVSEDLSFKRWAEQIDEGTYPDDVRADHLSRLHYCPSAQEAFGRLLDNTAVDQSLVLEALDATAHYLSIEEHAEQYPETADDHAITQFVAHLREAAQILRILKVLPDHEAYMEMHAHKMMNLVHGTDPGTKEEGYNMEGFKNFVAEKMDAAEAQSIRMDPHLDDKDLAAIEKHIDQMEWEDVRHILDQGKQKHQEAEEEFELDGELLEGLTAAQRMKKKMEFMKTKAKREIARKVALKRMSSQGKLKKKAIVHARKLILQRLLRGRNKASLSAAEKDRIEAIVNKAKGAIVRISNRLMPKLRELEQQRLKHMHEDWSESGDTEAKASDTVAQHDTDVSNNPTLAHIKSHLAGQPALDQGNFKPDAAVHVRRMKNYRKLEV